MATRRQHVELQHESKMPNSIRLVGEGITFYLDPVTIEPTYHPPDAEYRGILALEAFANNPDISENEMAAIVNQGYEKADWYEATRMPWSRVAQA